MLLNFKAKHLNFMHADLVSCLKQTYSEQTHSLYTLSDKIKKCRKCGKVLNQIYDLKTHHDHFQWKYQQFNRNFIK